MASVKDFYDFLKGVDVDSLTDAIIKENKSEIIDLNADRLSEGKNIDNITVGHYTYATEQISKESSPRPLKPKRAGEPYNFIWSGDLFSNMFIKHESEKLEIDSTGTGNSKKRDFVKKNRLLGFTESDEKFVNWDLLPTLFRQKFNALLRKI